MSTTSELDPRASRAAGMRMIYLAYAIALLVAMIAGVALADRHPIWIAAGADVAATVAIFLFSFAFRNSSFYDPYWSVAPVPIALYWWFGPGATTGDPVRQVLVFALVLYWAVRLTHNWWSGWTGLDHEDWRYIGLAEQTGRAYWGVSFSGIHMFPTVQVFLGCLALWPALTIGDRTPGWLDGVAAVVTAGALAIETLADVQLRRFKRGSREPEAILTSGLWAHSRHPNYLGEIGFWWGLWLFGLAADPSWWWTVIGPLAITVMFMTVSLRMIDNRMLERRPAYAEIMSSTPSLLPRPGRGAGPG